ncbi:MAG: 3'(2'),5'-bisphosphate nucleotidase CysQ [Pseudomonadota bacterium]
MGREPSDAAADLDLLLDVSREAGAVAMEFFRDAPEYWEKEGEAGPVSEADLAVNALLIERLRAARPEYGLLSEESDDTSDRTRYERVFIIDPIDGTRAFLKGERGFAVAAAVVDGGRPIAGVVHMPALGETYSAAVGSGAQCNGTRIVPSDRQALDGARALGASASYQPRYWPGGLPELQRTFRHALQWRLCLVAAGEYDLMATMRDAYEWDVAAGALIAAEAGALITDRDGNALTFNTPQATVPGVLVAPPVLHRHLVTLRTD